MDECRPAKVDIAVYVLDRMPEPGRPGYVGINCPLDAVVASTFPIHVPRYRRRFTPAPETVWYLQTELVTPKYQNDTPVKTRKSMFINRIQKPVF
jgi:hypothetical protein